MYLIPQEYQCAQCGFKCMQSPHEPHAAPRIDSYVGCPVCWKTWLEENIGQMILAKHCIPLSATSGKDNL